MARSLTEFGHLGRVDGTPRGELGSGGCRHVDWPVGRRLRALSALRDRPGEDPAQTLHDVVPLRRVAERVADREELLSSGPIPYALGGHKMVQSGPGDGFLTGRRRRSDAL